MNFNVHFFVNIAPKLNPIIDSVEGNTVLVRNRVLVSIRFLDRRTIAVLVIVNRISHNRLEVLDIY